MYTGISSQPVRYVNLGSGEMNISNNTLALMKEAIIQASKSPIVRDWATHIIQDVTAKDELGEAGAIYYFVQQHAHYVKDPTGTEMLQSPAVAFAAWQSGQVPFLDCDDYVILSLSLMRAIGIPVRMRAASYTADKVLGHVYGLAYINNQWMPMDLIPPAPAPGWENPAHTRLYDYSID